MRPENEPGGGSRCPGLIGLFFQRGLGIWFFNGCKPLPRNAARCRSLGFLLGGRNPLSLYLYISSKTEAVTSPDATPHLRRVPPGSRGPGPVPGVCRGREGRGAAPAPSLSPPPIAFARSTSK